MKNTSAGYGEALQKCRFDLGRECWESAKQFIHQRPAKPTLSPLKNFNPTSARLGSMVDLY